ncbi:adp-ribosylation factor family protein [Ophiostoma piceae UAMH 11346]|uniref:Adp-ribosylation factor family protein n=1 Tax=Ophiostoma piceae (strain UAMH 11346) TaxID=1262450 RepID=S3BZ43_OPHP1|nr:adp-ribosylation factor family protein [Ophiostoma piceae UAMH 11346]
MPGHPSSVLHTSYAPPSSSPSSSSPSGALAPSRQRPSASGDVVSIMAAIIRKMYEWYLRTFWATEMDVTMLGLQNAGKTCLLNVLSGGEFTYDTIPTIGFNMKRVQRNNVSMKCWDIGGQPRFRPMWERYCRGVNAILFVVDIADMEKLQAAREELHSIMEQPTLEGIPLLVLGNKSDLPEKMSVDELIDTLDLKSIEHREVSCYGISAKEETNLEAVLSWLVNRANQR